MVPIPLTDHIRRRSFWAFTLLLIVTNVWAFIIELSLGPHLNRVILMYGLIPARFSRHSLSTLPARLTVIPIFVSMFLHGGWLHLLGNMLFLFVFGRSIEDRVGHFPFLLLYLISGVAAALVQIVVSPGSRVPTIGASGAIAGVLGGYLRRLPQSPIHTLILFRLRPEMVAIPAYALLGLWLVLQFYGLRQGGPVAWLAHLGGFFIGLVTVNYFTPVQAERRQPARKSSRKVKTRKPVKRKA